MPSNLTIHPTKPFKSSRLALPPSPFSPRFPLSPPPAPATSHRATSPKAKVALALPTPPPEPLNWLWQCHLCNRVYRLGITRRCLEDGHYFCSGTTTVKRAKKGKNTGKKVVRHKACASEFDYAGWKAWGTWRRDCKARIAEVEGESEGEEGVVPKPLFAPSVPSEGRWFGGAWARKGKSVKGDEAGKEFWKKDCWGTCDYPSECRWGKQYGVATPKLPSAEEQQQRQAPPVPEKDDKPAKPKTRFEDILLDIPTVGASDADSGSDDDGDIAMQSPPLSPELPLSPEEPTRKPSFDDLLESVKRRKRRSAGAMVEVPSPLSSHPPSPTTVSMALAMDLATSTKDAEHVEDVTDPRRQGSEGVTSLQRTFDDFDVEFKRSFEMAGAVLTGFVGVVRGVHAGEGEKKDGIVRSLSVRREKERR